MIDLKSYFHDKYQGGENFIENVILPIFGEDKYEDAYEEDILENNPELIHMADTIGISQILRLGTIDIPMNPTDVFDITVSNHVQMERNRVTIQQLVRRIMSTYSSAFMVFHYDDDTRWDWRFTFCSKQGSNQDSTDSKRYTFLLGPNQSCRTAAENFKKLASKHGEIELDDIVKAFDVESLSKEFFEKYKVRYGRFVGHVIGKEYVDKGDGKGEWRDKEGLAPSELFYGLHEDEKVVRDYVKKLLGRIVFLHFLQKKGWLGATDEEWTNGPQDFMHQLFNNATTEQKENFLDDILEPLFSCLDTPLDERHEIFDTKVDGLRSVRVPFLGGLFERTEEDKAISIFPSELFADLFKFLNEYNFTIDENDPNDAQVGVDPEMLGRIFENLLEDNKDKGAFYTPKEIVQYMSRESLIAYLQTDVTDESTREALRQFVTTHDVSVIGGRDSALAKNVSQCLSEVKICDPAIGSGAFPMGLLNELFLCRGVIEDFSNAADIKRHIIQQNIYGVDIEKGAVEIARLRFWLSLITDADKPDALPNMDFKIMQGNSLLEQYKGFDLSPIMDTKTEIHAGHQYNMFEEEIDVIRAEVKQAIKRYYSEQDHVMRRTIRQGIQEKIQKQVEAQGVAIDINEVKDIAANDQFFLWHTWFSEVFDDGGFDIVIGNPPYIKEYDNRSAFNGFRESSPYYTGKMDIWHGFACHCLDMLKERGILSFIAQNNWTTNEGAKLLRKKIVEDAKIIQMIDFNDYMIFEDSASIQTMIMMFSHDNISDDYLVDYRKLTAHSSKQDMLSFLSKEGIHVFLTPTFNRDYYSDKYITFSKNNVLLSKIASQPGRLVATEVAQGIVFPQDFLNKEGQKILGNYHVGDGIFGLSTTELDQLNLSEEEMSLIRPYYTTNQIHRYFTEEGKNTLWMIYTGSKFKKRNSLDKYPSIKIHLDKFERIITSDYKPYGIHRARVESNFKGKKIISLRKCDGHPSFSYSECDCFVTQTFFTIKTNRWNLKFLTGILNSKLIEFWLLSKCKKQGENFQIDKTPLLGIPLPIESTEQTIITTAVDQLLSAKKSDINANTLEIEAQIDSLVYDIYGLTKEEISIVEETISERYDKTGNPIRKH